MVIWFLFFIISGTILLSGKYLEKNRVILLLMTFIIFISGFRYKIGLDYDNYVNIYRGLAESSIYYMKATEPGWKIINYIANIFNNYQGIFLLSSIIIYYLIIKSIEKESENIYFSLILFFITPYYFWHSWAMIRQYIAVAFFMYSIRYIYNKKLIKYLICIFIGSCFHMSIALVLPIYFIVRKEFSKKFWIITLCFAGVLPNLFGKIIISLEMFQKYSWYLEEGVAVTQGRNKYIHLLIKIILFLLVILLKDKMNYKIDIKKRVLINIYMFGLIIFILFFNSSAIRRLAYYFMIIEVIIIPLIFKIKISKKNILYFIRNIFTIYYFIYICTAFYMEVVNHSNVIEEDSQANTYYRMNFKGD